MNLLIAHGSVADMYLVRVAQAMGHSVHFMCNRQEKWRLDETRRMCDPDVFIPVQTRFDLKLDHELYLSWYHLLIHGYVRDHDIHAILPSSSMDIIMEQVAIVNETYELPGIRPDRSRLFRDKAEYLPLLQAAGVPTPKIHEIVEPGGEPTNYDLPYPVLAKPGFGCGGFGIYIPEDSERLRWFFGPSDNPNGFSERALFYQDRDFSGQPKSYLHFGMGGRYIIQDYIEGPCISLAGTAAGGKLTLNMAYDIGVTPPPTCAEISFGWPSNHNVAELALELTEQLSEALTFPDGAWMADTILGPDGRLYVVDLAPRMSSSGTKMLHHACDNAAYSGNVISCLLHGEADYTVRPKIPTAYHMLPFPKGRLTNIRYPDLGVDSHATIVEKVTPIQGEGRVFEMRNDVQVADRGWVVGQALEGDRSGADHIVKRFIQGITYDLET